MDGQVSVGAAQSYIEGTFGGPTEEVDGEVSVGVAVKRLVDNNPERLALTIVNLGVSDVYVWIDDQVGATRGILLLANGGTMSTNVVDDQTLPTRAWWAVTASGDTNLAYLFTQRYALTEGP